MVGRGEGDFSGGGMTGVTGVDVREPAVLRGDGDSRIGKALVLVGARAGDDGSRGVALLVAATVALVGVLVGVEDVTERAACGGSGKSRASMDRLSTTLTRAVSKKGMNDMMRFRHRDGESCGGRDCVSGMTRRPYLI
jgi:hypothetical protein